MAADLRTPDFDSYPLDATVEQGRIGWERL